MKDQHKIQVATPGRSAGLSLTLCALLCAGTMVVGCSTARREQPAGNASRPFNAEEVTKLSHEAYKVAWDAKFWARRDLRFAAFMPTALDWETIEYLGEIIHHVPWVAWEIEKHPATAPLSSKRSNEFVQYDALMLKKRYQPTSFRSSTNAKIEKLMRILEEIACYYDEGGGGSYR